MENNSTGERIVTLYMKALRDEKLSEAAWRRISSVNKIVLDKF